MIKKRKGVVALLLILPIYIPIIILLKILNINIGNSLIILPVLMYLPLVFGIIFLYKKYPNILLLVLTIITLLITIYFYYSTYFINHPGWEALTPFIWWLITTALCRLFACVYYGKAWGLKKALLLASIYIIISLLSFGLGFWS